MPVFKGTKSFYNHEISDIVAQNLKSWLEYGLLEVGAYTPITFDSPASGYTVLQRAYDDRYGADRVFEGLGEWAWESDVSTSISGLDPVFRVSGVYVDDDFYPLSTSGAYAHTID